MRGNGCLTKMNHQENTRLIFLIIYLILFKAQGLENCPHKSNGKDHLTLSQSKVERQEGTKLTVTCKASCVQQTIRSLKWELPQNPQLTQHYYKTNQTVSLTILRLNGSDAGTYRCELVTDGGYVETKELNLLVKHKDQGGLPCAITQFKCKMSQDCLFLRHRCDGRKDCEDGSDEECEVDPCINKFRCNNSLCIPQDELCNHIDNCGDASDEGAACRERTYPATVPRKTIFLVIASIILIVILICFIVIHACRVKMKRQRREARLMSAMRSARQLQELAETSRSMSQTEDNGSEGQPFLLNSYQPYRHGTPNIIVNVNNGVQYMPQYDYPLRPFAEAPPPYSEITTETNETSDNNAPPPYSTLTQDLASGTESSRLGPHNKNASNVPSPHAAAVGVDGRVSSERLARNERGDMSRVRGRPESEVSTGSGSLEGSTSASSSSSSASRSRPQSGQTFGSDNHHQRTTAAIEIGVPPLADCESAREDNGIHEVSTIQSRPRSGVIQPCDGPPLHIVSGERWARGEDDPAASPSHGANVEQLSSSRLPPLGDPMAAHNNSLPPSTSRGGGPHRHSPSRPTSSGGTVSPAGRSYHASDSEPLLQSLTASSSPVDGQRTAGEGEGEASRALLQEVSRRDERSKPPPGHLSVQGGQIVLHTDNGMIAGQSNVNNSSDRQHHQQASNYQPSAAAAASQFGGELVVKDGVIMLQIPVSKLILDKQQLQQQQQLLENAAMTPQSPLPPLPSSSSSPTAATVVESAVVTDENEAHHNPADTAAVSRPTCHHNDSLSPQTNNPSSSLSVESSTLPLPSDLSPDVPSSSPLSSSPSSSAGRFCGDLNIRDGQIVLEPPRHTASSQILSHLQGAYSQEEKDPLLATDPDDRPIEAVVNTKRIPGATSGGGRHLSPKCNSDVVLPHGKDHHQHDSL